MNYVEADRGRASRISRLALIAGLVALIPGTGLTLEIHPPANEHAGRTPSATAADGQSDREKMQGNWKIVRCEFSGRNQDQAVGVEDTISDARWLRPNRRTAEYRLKLDSTKDPKSVDLSADRLGDQTLKGIYSLEGDRLTICYSYDPQGPRPTEFKTTEATAAYLYVLVRAKKE
jgi:uncharacterized protein (TIGR03067 family)